MLGAGTPLPDALRTARHLAVPAFQSIVDEILHDVTNGRTLESALAAHSRHFASVHVAIVAAGENSGQLPAALQRAVLHMEREAAFRSRLLSASIYPIILATAGTCTLGLLAVFVLPRFAELIISSGGRLPPLAIMLIDGADFARHHFLVLSMASMGLLAGLIAVTRRPEIRTAISQLSFRTPVFGPTRSAAVAAQFLRNAGTLVGAGIPIVRALDRYANSVHDPIVRALVLEARDGLRAGRTVKDVFTGMGFVPAVAIQLVGAGESAGDITGHMLRAAELVEEDLERHLGRLLTLLEPALILVFGLLIGFTALALLQAVYGLHSGVFL